MGMVVLDARHLSDEVLEAFRVRAVHACELGFHHEVVAGILGVAPETVSRWWSAYTSGGMDALPHERTGHPVGSGRSLSEEQSSRIQGLIDTHQPDELGIASPLWNRAAVRQLIGKECQVMMPVRTVGEYLKRWGYTCKRPQRHSRKQDPKEVRKWLEETYPIVKKRAKMELAEILWCDETGVAADEHPGYGYARVGRPATMKVPDSHIRVNMISAISNEGTVHFMTYFGAMTAALFIVFLERLLHDRVGKLFVIVDHLRAHEKDTVTSWAAARQDQIELFWLPRRSPELNPDEYLNQDLKANVHATGLPDNKHELRSRVQSFMRRLLRLPEHIINYFRQTSVQYAAAIP